MKKRGTPAGPHTPRPPAATAISAQRTTSSRNVTRTARPSTGITPGLAGLALPIVGANAATAISPAHLYRTAIEAMHRFLPVERLPDELYQALPPCIAHEVPIQNDHGVVLH